MNTQTLYEKLAFLASSNSCIGIFRIHAFRMKLSMEKIAKGVKRVQTAKASLLRLGYD